VCGGGGTVVTAGTIVRTAFPPDVPTPTALQGQCILNAFTADPLGLTQDCGQNIFDQIQDDVCKMVCH
jgi:hypothetical protein